MVVRPPAPLPDQPIGDHSKRVSRVGDEQADLALGSIHIDVLANQRQEFPTGAAYFDVCRRIARRWLLTCENDLVFADLLQLVVGRHD